MTKKFSLAIYEKKQHEQAIQMLTELLKKLKRGEMVAEDSGFWQGATEGRFTFRVIAKTRETLN